MSTTIPEDHMAIVVDPQGTVQVWLPDRDDPVSVPDIWLAALMAAMKLMRDDSWTAAMAEEFHTHAGAENGVTRLN